MKENNNRAAITGTGAFLPAKRLTNYDLERMVDTSSEWIIKRTGIKERRIVEDGVATSDLAAIAATKALEDANVSPKDVDLIITSTITPDSLFPSTSCYVQKKIGAKKAGAFDVLAACAGFIYALSIGQNYINSGAMNTVLVIGAECLSKVTDYTDRTTCILFGDGAGATVLQRGNKRSHILSTFLGADGNHTDVLSLPAGGSKMPPSTKTLQERLHYIKFRGREVFKLAITNLTELITKTVTSSNLTIDDISLFILHQSNFRIIEATMERLKIPREKIFHNIEKYGNTSSASIPIALDEAKKEGRLKPGDLVLLAAFGGGLTWSSSIVRW
ncbi:MAG: beta-ketoacyl-ACP synthase III [Candidatus Brocadiales bacterium]|nr:beta-ketoacyl-ACP synthase III [Candidatus Brocadiales bacterium]